MKLIKSAIYDPCGYGETSINVVVTYTDGTKYTLYDVNARQIKALQRQIQIQIYRAKAKC